MDSRTTWLCPTPLHRERLLEMEAKLARPRALMYGSLAAAFAASIPWVGVGPVALLAVAVMTYWPLSSRLATSARPEHLVALSVINAQLLLGAGIALTGGPHSPAIPMVLLPLVTLPARFSSRGVYAGLAVTVAILLASTVAVDPADFARDPTYTLTGLAISVGLTAFAHLLMRVEMESRSEAVLDSLTGLLNRKALAGRFEEIAQQASLAGGSVCLLACDLDHFKQVNDIHGHDRGDHVLREVAYVMRKHLRSFELVYRVGGEEFLVVLPDAGLVQGREVAERLRAAIEAARPCGLHVTASVGVAAASGDGVVYERLYRDADGALYEAKRAGRNRVVAAGPALVTA
ncbi:MAG TPA: GGDEF domain-containing protein [Solirubrobacter sp.]|nr:GGDEF domain-containing protein [Solirubrobacter sp.]